MLAVFFLNKASVTE
ncbi:hypothetical protein ECEC1847_2263, partial [Escherichia coli EC1847]